MSGTVTAYTTKDIPDGLWDHWKDPIPRSVSLGERNIRLLAADVACRENHGQGIIELAIDEGLIDEDDIEAALEKDPIE